ncbi:hypothetical protein Lfu02_08190 [Longispora fulva]|uniref:CAAX prenyl protease 2/Lysostaphin resistance protein A-like domain-containing protein n=1 Tax=Longispora fulva TaxID=619741 RepID=A0A8J7GLP9_9ACTN|nr:CPBP family glutamic-type intramembrane protease [Longispora fulva]MBG6135314.1 hypothetical protein [Longispora fulva]GIG56447.1 hypothetical protein Lfu02_08190 [Longispora fulva]
MTALWGLLAAAAWLAVYRLPLRSPRTRQRFRLWVASRTPLPGRLVFPVVGTAIYLVAGLLAAGGLAWVAGVRLPGVLSWRVTPHGAATTLLAVVGANALTGFAMGVVAAARPGLDLAGAVTTVRWVQEVGAFGRRWRWVVPMISAAVEEFFFRGVLLFALLGHGTPAWLAVAVAGLVFTTGQVLLTENRTQALVLGLASGALSLVGGLLVLAEGSVLPAVLVHASFAGYYTHASFDRRAHG